MTSTILAPVGARGVRRLRYLAGDGIPRGRGAPRLRRGAAPASRSVPALSGERASPPPTTPCRSRCWGRCSGSRGQSTADAPPTRTPASRRYPCAVVGGVEGCPRGATRIPKSRRYFNLVLGIIGALHTWRDADPKIASLPLRRPPRRVSRGDSHAWSEPGQEISRAGPPRSRRRRFSSYPSSPGTHASLHRRRRPAPPSARAA